MMNIMRKTMAAIIMGIMGLAASIGILFIVGVVIGIIGLINGDINGAIEASYRVGTVLSWLPIGGICMGVGLSLEHN